MGESPGAEISVFGSELESFSVETPGGRIQIRWDYRSQRHAERATGLFRRVSCHHRGVRVLGEQLPADLQQRQRISHKRDVLGTWFLSILAGHHRYAHITALRGDGVSPQILGMSKIVSEDTLRRALARMSADAESGLAAAAAAVQRARRRWTRRGSWISTPPSRRCSASRAGPRSVTTRTSRAAPAMPCTLTL